MVDDVFKILCQQVGDHINQELACVHTQNDELSLVTIVELLLTHDFHVQVKVNCKESVSFVQPDIIHFLQNWKASSKI